MKKINNTVFLCILLHIKPTYTILQQITDTTKNYFTHIKTYYAYNKHLSESIYFLSQLSECNYCYVPCNTLENKYSLQIDSVIFFHHKIQSCLHKALQTASLKPIIKFLKETRYSLNIKDQPFIHELFLLIFIVHKQIILHTCEEMDHTLKKTTLNTIMEVSDKINQLPITEVLDAIDMLMTELPPFLEKYELNSTITWKNWIKKYWWVPPIFGGWFTLRVLVNFQRARHDRYSKPPRLHDTIITDPELLKITREKMD